MSANSNVNLCHVDRSNRLLILLNRLINLESKYFQNHIDPNKTIEQSKPVTRIYRMKVNIRNFGRLKPFTLDFITSWAPEVFFPFVCLIFRFYSYRMEANVYPHK